MSNEGSIETCSECGASVYPEHVESGKAQVIDGKLRCPHCLEAYRKPPQGETARIVGGQEMKSPGESGNFEPIAIDDSDDSDASMASSQVRTLSGDTLLSSAASLHDQVDYKRPIMPDGAGATRCRTFHAKLNDGAVGFMNRQINEWCDGQEDVVIKFATSTIGVWEGKKPVPTLIVTIFY